MAICRHGIQCHSAYRVCLESDNHRTCLVCVCCGEISQLQKFEMTFVHILLYQLIYLISGEGYTPYLQYAAICPSVDMAISYVNCHFTNVCN